MVYIFALFPPLENMSCGTDVVKQHHAPILLMDYDIICTGRHVNSLLPHVEKTAQRVIVWTFAGLEPVMDSIVRVLMTDHFNRS